MQPAACADQQSPPTCGRAQDRQDTELAHHGGDEATVPMLTYQGINPPVGR